MSSLLNDITGTNIRTGDVRSHEKLVVFVKGNLNFTEESAVLLGIWRRRGDLPADQVTQISRCLLLPH